MSLKNLIILFIVILILLGGVVYYQFYVRGITTGGQPKLTTETVTIDGHSFTAEMAKTTPQQEMGLSDRSNLPTNDAMIFIFNSETSQSFWMKEMKFPLDIVFIGKHKIGYIAQNVPIPPTGNVTPPIIQPPVLSDTVLEINAGLAKQYHFKVGDTVTTSQ